MARSPLFDVFLSYKSEDVDAAIRLKDALSSRGVRVWRDKDEIRPGDRFAQALEQGLESSRAVALLVTPKSVASEWVRDEYYRALSLTNESRLQLIPIVYQQARLPGFLANRHAVSIADDADFEVSVDKIVWPGITGKQVVFQPVFGVYQSERWQRLFRVAKSEGLLFAEGEDIDRVKSRLPKLLADDRKRVVVVIDPFEERPARDTRWRNSVADYVEFILELRERTRGQPNEPIFILYIQSDAWTAVGEVAALPHDLVKRFAHYFVVPQDIDTDLEFAALLRDVWLRVQRELLLSTIATDDATA